MESERSLAAGIEPVLEPVVPPRHGSRHRASLDTCAKPDRVAGGDRFWGDRGGKMRASTLFALLWVVLLIAGCGDSDSSETGVTTTVQETTAMVREAIAELEESSTAEGKAEGARARTKGEEQEAQEAQEHAEEQQARGAAGAGGGRRPRHRSSRRGTCRPHPAFREEGPRGCGIKADVSNTDAAFGILVPENYTICKQSRRAAT